MQSIPMRLRAPRTSTWLAVAALLVIAIAIVAPVQLPIVLYKACLVALAVVLGYWADRALFPYARPDGYLKDDWRHGIQSIVEMPPERGEGRTWYDGVDFPVEDGYHQAFAAAMLRRALIVAAIVIAIAVGL